MKLKKWLVARSLVLITCSNLSTAAQKNSCLWSKILLVSGRPREKLRLKRKSFFTLSPLSLLSLEAPLGFSLASLSWQSGKRSGAGLANDQHHCWKDKAGGRNGQENNWPIGSSTFLFSVGYWLPSKYYVFANLYWFYQYWHVLHYNTFILDDHVISNISCQHCLANENNGHSLLTSPVAKQTQ